MSGIASPRFKHGRYSKYLPAQLLNRYRQAEKDPRLLELADEIALIDVRMAEIMSRIRDGDSSELWAECKKTYAEARAHMFNKNHVSMGQSLQELGELLTKGAAIESNWKEVYKLIDQRVRVVESERKRMVEMRQMIRVEEAMVPISQTADIIKRHVSDRNVLAAIAEEVRRLTGGPDRSRDAAIKLDLFDGDLRGELRRLSDSQLDRIKEILEEHDPTGEEVPPVGNKSSVN